MSVDWKGDIKLYPLYLHKRIAASRGIGHGKQYVPWLKVREVPSSGTSSIVLGIEDGRAHHLLSELEATYFYLMERRSTTLDIREQWPILKIYETLELCAGMKVTHAYRKGFPEPFTIDFLLTEIDAEGHLTYRAASIKTPADAVDQVVRRRLRVEKQWCEDNEIAWTLVDTRSFTKQMLSNLRFMRSWFRHRLIINDKEAARFADQFIATYQTNVHLEKLIEGVGKKISLKEEKATDIFRYCAWYNLIPVSLKHPLALNRPLTLDR